MLLREVKDAAQGFAREVCDQLDRASLSALLNTAEGNGKRQTRQRAKFFDDARGSAVECAACLDAVVAKGLAKAERITDGKAMLLRIVGMLSKLVERFDDGSCHVREDTTDFEETNPPRPSSSIGETIDREKQIEDEDEGRGRGREGGFE
jgi:four helix bundle protein